MNFPSKLSIEFVDVQSSHPIKNLVIFFTLFAKEKNNYTIGPFLSNKEGRCIIVRDKVKQDIKSSQSMYVMDYKSQLEECKDEFTVHIASIQQIKFFLEDYKKYQEVYKKYWNYSEDFLSEVKSNTNSIYKEQEFLVDLSNLEKKSLIFRIRKNEPKQTV